MEDDDNKKQLIRARAYALWMQDGCPLGRDLDYWLQAERELAEEDREHERIVETHPSRQPPVGSGR